MPTAKSPLTNLGYSLVAWPKAAIYPLLLLYKTANGVSSIDARLAELFKTGDVAPPRIIRDDEAADIKGSAALVFDASAGVNILDWLLNKLHLGKMSADVKLNKSYEVTVSYKNIREDKVSLLALDGYLSRSKPSRERLNTFREKLEQNELYVITAAAKSADISISIASTDGQDISTDSTVKGIVEANMKAVRKKNEVIELAYKTDEDKPVVFAFKAQQIIYDKKTFWGGGTGLFYIKDQIGSVLLSSEDVPTRPLKTLDLIEL